MYDEQNMKEIIFLCSKNASNTHLLHKRKYCPGVVFISGVVKSSTASELACVY